jgi:hypothetical protein
MHPARNRRRKISFKFRCRAPLVLEFRQRRIASIALLPD